MDNTISQNIVVFKKQMSAYGLRDIDTLMTTFADDCILRDMAAPNHPYEGKKAVRGFLEGYFSTIRNVEVTISTITSNENTVIGELEVTADWVAPPYSESAPRRVCFRYAVIDTIIDGHVTYERFYWDSKEFDLQLTN